MNFTLFVIMTSFVDLHCYMEYGLSHNYFQANFIQIWLSKWIFGMVTSALVSLRNFKLNFMLELFCILWFSIPKNFIPDAQIFSYQLLTRLVTGQWNAIVCVIYVRIKLWCLFILLFIEFCFVVVFNVELIFAQNSPMSRKILSAKYWGSCS